MLRFLPIRCPPPPRWKSHCLLQWRFHTCCAFHQIVPHHSQDWKDHASSNDGMKDFWNKSCGLIKICVQNTCYRLSCVVWFELLYFAIALTNVVCGVQNCVEKCIGVSLNDSSDPIVLGCVVRKQSINIIIFLHCPLLFLEKKHGAFTISQIKNYLFIHYCSALYEILLKAVS